MNHATANGYNFFMYYDCNDNCMKLLDISETGSRFTIYGEYMTNKSLLHRTKEEALKSLGGYTKPVIYHGKNINVWERDIFLYVSTKGEIYEKYHKRKWQA